jgi:predicted nucleotidyltransferase
MAELKIPEKTKHLVTGLVNQLQDIYQSELISILAYGSAVSGGFVAKRSRVDLLVILKDSSPERLKKAQTLVKKNTFYQIIFFDEKFISQSLDTFPIEFLDIKEAYLVLSGQDILQDKLIDTANLRFQCEAELKEKLIALKQQYIKICRDPKAMRQLLLVSFSSLLHIIKSALRLMTQNSYAAREEIIKEAGLRFGLNTDTWNTLLWLKNGKVRLAESKVEGLFIAFVKDLEKISARVDTL